LLTPADFDAAFRGFVPSALKELALNDGSGTDAGAADASPTAGWESVGGLFSLKRTLLDTLELPTRYSMLFAAAPLKLRSGLLIYGPPGCGLCTRAHDR
jgi:peroxin-1